jgi:hypothetical protein
MKIKNARYRVLIDIYKFETEVKQSSFVLFTGEEYLVNHVFEQNGIGFVDLGTYVDEFGKTKSRIISIDTFVNSFEEIID